MSDLTDLERRCVARINEWRERCAEKGRWLTLDEVHAEIVRAVLAEAGAIGEPEINYEIWQGDEMQASSTDEADARHYAAVYGQDGPVELVRAVTYRQKVQP